MAGVFGVTPLQTYPSWAQGLEQGTGAIANAILQRRQLDLQRQQLAMQQAQAGYQPPQQAQVYQPGRLNAPSMVASENIPTGTPGATGMGPSTGPAGALGVAPAGTPDTMARTAGSYKTVNQPGYYDLTKSLPYLTSMARVLEMQQRGVEAAKIGAASRETVAGMNDDTRVGISNNVHGYIGKDGQVHYGMDYYNPVGVSGFNNGQWVTDPTTGERTFQNGVQTQGRIEAAQPGIQLRGQIADVQHADRQASLAERTQRDQQNAAARAARSGPLPGVVTPPGFRAPTQSDINKINSRAGGIMFNNPAANPDSARAEATHQLNLVYAGQGADTLVNRPFTPGVTLPQTGGSIGDRIAAYIKNALTGPPKAASGAAPAPHVPTSGNDPVVLQQHSRAPQGGNAPTLRLGNRPVADNTTATYPKGNNLPASPDAPTAKASGVSKAAIDAAYAKALKDGWSPADAEAKRQQMYKANGIKP